MDFTNITTDNAVLYAMKYYDNPACHGIQEFHEDLDRIKYIKRLLKRYQTKGILKERLILNHIIVVYNVFGVEAATRLLFLRIEKDLWVLLKTFLVFLNTMPEVVCGIDGEDIKSLNVNVSEELAVLLRAITWN